MITKEQIKSGFESGKIRLITDPNLESSTVCAMGDTNDLQFYFGGLTAEELTPEEYLRAVPMEDVIEKIYTALSDMASYKFSHDEYALYESLLKKEKKKGFEEEEFMIYAMQQFRDDEICMLRETLKKIIEYGKKYKRTSKDQFCNQLADMIPLLSLKEVAMFLEDGCLTECGQEQKAAVQEQYMLGAENQ